MVNLNIIFYTILIIISIIDIKYMVIPDSLLIILFLTTLFKFSDMHNLYVGMAIFSFPLFLLLLIEDYFSKELIGSGDIKLMLCIGAHKGIVKLEYLFYYYVMIYLVALIYCLILICIFKYDKQYIPFAPMITIALLIC